MSPFYVLAIQFILAIGLVVAWCALIFAVAMIPVPFYWLYRLVRAVFALIWQVGRAPFALGGLGSCRRPAVRRAEIIDPRVSEKRTARP
jgi:hypothetical protein